MKNRKATKKNAKRIYVVIPAIIETRTGYVRQPRGRQFAQGCHVVSKLRHSMPGQREEFQPITTIILAARSSRTMVNAWVALHKKRLDPVFFSDENKEAYGDFRPVTAMAVYATPKQTKDALSVFPLWGS